MKPHRLILLLCLLGCSFSATAQEICFEDFVTKVGQPLHQALKTAKGDKEIDSLYNLADIARQKLVGCQMPDFTAKTHTGKPMSRASLKGKVVVMNFWFIGCKPCVAEMPALNRLTERYKAEGVVFIAFGDDARKPATQTFLRKHPFDYQQIANKNKFSNLFTISSWPTNLVFDQTGKLVHLSHGGFIDERAKTEMYDKLTPIIDGLLLKK